MPTPTKRIEHELPQKVVENFSRYLEKSKDRKDDYLQSKEPDYIYSPAYNDCWADFDVYDDILWIRTAFSKCSMETKEAWEELKEIARDMGCKKIQFTTKRDGKIWERLFDDMKVVQWKVEVDL